MKKQDFYYDLPENLIAQTPLYPRDSSRLICYNKTTKEIEHRIFRDITNYLNKGDVLVINTTRVIQARLFASDNKGRAYELLLLKRLDLTCWETLIKPARKAKIGDTLKISDDLKCQIKGIIDNGIRIIQFEYQGVFEEILDRCGEMPLPPYIKEKLDDKERYQTVYSKEEGSSAAPTAGLHFTPELLNKIKEKGVELVEVLLHVGLGTFRPVKEDNILAHQMHEEYYVIEEKQAQAINKAKEEGRRIIAVGTTCVRTLESATNEKGEVEAKAENTDIFIYPSYNFKTVNALITNFHLPESTLIMLVSALIGREETLNLYNIAVKEEYRFFSFGDAMFLY